MNLHFSSSVSYRLATDEIMIGTRRTRSTWTFIDAIEQNQTYTAWGGRQSVSYDCSLRVKYMEP